MKAVLMAASMVGLAVALHIPAPEEASLGEIPDGTVLAAATDAPETDDAIGLEQDDFVVVDADAAEPGEMDGDHGADESDHGLASDVDAAAVTRCRGRYCYNADDVRAVLRTVGPRTQCVVRYEIGGFGYSPNLISPTNDAGPVQVHLGGGKHHEAEAAGLDIWSPWDMIPWLENQLATGQGSHWSPVVRHLC